jgi:putative phage-type endonuclease
MSIRIYEDIVQGEDAWLELRRGLITASVIGQLITPGTIKPASNDKSRALLAQLAAERITGQTDNTFVNDDMMRGTLHEPIARDKYAEHNNVTVQEVGFVIREDWGGIRIGASPDGLVGNDGGIEIKCPRAKAHIQTVLSGEVPAYNMAQVQATLLVTGREWWDFISFCAGLPMFTKRVTLDPKWRDSIITAATTAEHAIGSMVQRFQAASEHLPPTEYIPYYDDTVELKLA